MSLTSKQRRNLKSWCAALRPTMRRVYERQNKRIKEAGKHVCIRQKSGSSHRVTGRGDRILKRPVLQVQFFECKICGREMGHRLGAKS